MNRRRLEELVLARLVASKGRAPGERDVKRSLWPFVRHAFSPAEWSAELERLFAKLADAKLLSRRPLALTPLGKKRVLAAFRAKSIPDRIGWRELTRNYLSTHAAGGALGDARKKKDTDAIRALVIARHHRLPRGAERTLGRAIDALVWRELGIESAEALSLTKIRRAMLSRVLGSARSMELEDQKRLLAARAAGAVSSDATALETAVVRAWLDEDEGGAFARTVLEAAVSPEVERFGEGSAFIASIWRKMRESPPHLDLSLDEFKRRLVDANRAGLVRLQRADLVGAMDPRAVADSETRHLNAVFHFVECAPEKRS